MSANAPDIAMHVERRLPARHGITVNVAPLQGFFGSLGSRFPGRLPWAGMCDAVGVGCIRSKHAPQREGVKHVSPGQRPGV